MAHDVFISHSTQDKVVADAVCAALETEKIRCWIAPRDIKSGESWAEAITKALKSSRLMVLIFSDHSNQSKQVANELTLAVNAKAVVVPLKIEDIPPTHIMEYYLTGAHWLDAMNPPTEEQIKRLVETVKRALDHGSGASGIPIAEHGAAAFDREAKKPLSVIKKVGLAAVALLLSGLLIYGSISLFAQLGHREDASEDLAEGSITALSLPEIGTIVVTSTEDDGEGTLRRALIMATPEDVITFDPQIFPPENPATIYPLTPLPPLQRGDLTINASNAGVIIDGSKGQDENYFAGLTIQSANNIIAGLQIINCRVYNTDPEHEGPAGAGILIQGFNATGNIIGGDRAVGSGPVGQGNLLSANVWGLDIQAGASGNIVSGNLIGTDSSGANRHQRGGNDSGMIIENSSNNIIGPDNIIAFNSFAAMYIGAAPHIPINVEAQFNTVTGNSIFNNGSGIELLPDGNKGIVSPRITYFNLAQGIVRGSTCPGCIVEIFSDRGNQGRDFEGRVQADENGSFNFEAGKSLTGPNITATATDADGNTSAFSSPAGQSQ
jgi:hypothetical protein